MDYYFLVITIIDVFALSVMCVFVKCNETLKKELRFWFITSFLLIIIISILELLTVIVDNGPASLRWVNILANYLGFGLTPAVSIVLSFTLGENRAKKKAIAVELIYLLFLAISLPFGMVFYVDQNNHYIRGDAFGLYLATYCMSIIYLLIATVEIASKYQSRSKNSIYLIAVFLLIGSKIQIACPQIHISWLCVTLLAMLYYLYCNIIWQQLDGLTGLLNQNSYLNQTLSLNRDTTLIVFDIDDFKDVNDNYSHLVGDECLKEVAAAIREAYSKDGFCYRMGGDEFCVLLNIDADQDACEKVLMDELEARKKSLSMMPSVSFGCATFRVGDDIEKVKNIADKNMYRMKSLHKGY